MHALQAYILHTGQWSFLAGVFLLIVRNNTYPWPIKRASDVLFLVSLLSFIALAIFFKERAWFDVISKKVLFGLTLIFLGLGIATLINSVSNNVPLGGTGILAFGRFVEVGAILLLVKFFQSHDRAFYKKVAVAQLGTLVYLGVLIVPNKLYVHMYRFQLFENWPSNVGYYLITSLILLIVFMMGSLNPFRKIFFFYYVSAIGLFGVFLWTQSRASWLSLAIAALVILPVWAYKSSKARFRNFFAGGLLIVSLVPLGLLVLPQPIQVSVIGRLFPQAQPYLERYLDPEVTPSALLKSIAAEKLTLSLYEPSRPDLWRIYAKRILEKPLGLGASYEPVIYQGTARGPHNTLLEILVLGGVAALIGFVYLFFLGFKNLFAELKTARNARWPLYVFGSLLGLTIASFFDNMSTFRLMWIVLAQSIFFPESPKAALPPNPLKATSVLRTKVFQENAQEAKGE